MTNDLKMTTPGAFSGPLAVGVDDGWSLSGQTAQGLERLTDGETEAQAVHGTPGKTWGSAGRGTLKAALAWSGEGQSPSFCTRFLLPVLRGRGPGQGLRPIIVLRPAGKRWSTACAYLHPALTRANLRAEDRAFVSRVLFDGTRAVGVEYVKNGQSHRVSQLPRAWAAQPAGRGRAGPRSRLHRNRDEKWERLSPGLRGGAAWRRGQPPAPPPAKALGALA